MYNEYYTFYVRLLEYTLDITIVKYTLYNVQLAMHYIKNICRGSGMSGFRTVGVPECRGSGMSGFRTVGVPGVNRLETEIEAGSIKSNYSPLCIVLLPYTIPDAMLNGILEDLRTMI